MTEPAAMLKTTCLHQAHLDLAARMVPFGGWDMPIQYHSILEEHRAVRTAAGMFDVSHMGRVDFHGPDCIAYLQRLFTCDVTKVAAGSARYTLLCVEDGGILDDTILYCRNPESFVLICNASNTPAVLDWLAHWKLPGEQVAITERTAETGMIALQGPQAAAHMRTLANPEVADKLAYFTWTETMVNGSAALVTRTGYTGEDGFEIIMSAQDAPNLWHALSERGVMPCGLGARDTLRLEAALPLHGNDISLHTNPIQAGLGWAVALDKNNFIGRDAILAMKEQGAPTRLVGFEVTGRGIPRPHCPLLDDGHTIGETTSGGFAPTLQKGIGMGYVAAAGSKPGLPITVDIRGTMVPAQTVRRPFYKRPPAA